MKAFSNNLKLITSILINSVILSPSSQMSAWADVVVEPGYSVTLLNDELAGPVELDFDRTGNIFVANEGAHGVFAFEDFVSKISPTSATITRKFIDNLEGASGLKVDTNGNIYVSQDLGIPINKYDSTGAFIFSFEPHRPSFSDPNTLALTQDGRLLAAVENVPSDNQWRVLAYNVETGQRLADFIPSFEFGFVNAVVYRNGQVLIGGAVGNTTEGPILIAEEGQNPVAYAYNDRLPPGSGVNGLVVDVDGNLFVTDNTQLRKISTDGSVTLLATGFKFARGLAEKDGCILVAEFSDGITGSLYGIGDTCKPEFSNPQVALLITDYYQAILGRAPEPAGLAFWESEIDRVHRLGIDIQEAFRIMAGQFFTSAEYLNRQTSDPQYVTDLYKTFLNRDPDSGGLSYWTDQLTAGLPRSVVLFHFLFSSEFFAYMQDLFGDTASRGEVAAVVDFYRGFLNRLPDDDGFHYWLNRYRLAQCQAANAITAEVDRISAQFMASSEYTSRERNNHDFIADLYYTFLRRGSESSGFNYWANQLNSNILSRDAARETFIQTSEFQNRVTQIINEGCLPK